MSVCHSAFVTFIHHTVFIKVFITQRKISVLITLLITVYSVFTTLYVTRCFLHTVFTRLFSSQCIHHKVYICIHHTLSHIVFTFKCIHYTIYHTVHSPQKFWVARSLAPSGLRIGEKSMKIKPNFSAHENQTDQYNYNEYWALYQICEILGPWAQSSGSRVGQNLYKIEANLKYLFYFWKSDSQTWSMFIVSIEPCTKLSQAQGSGTRVGLSYLYVENA